MILAQPTLGRSNEPRWINDQTSYLTTRPLLHLTGWVQCLHNSKVIRKV
jgi:hypothetical protein